jgi:hypothetical protein
MENYRAGFSFGLINRGTRGRSKTMAIGQGYPSGRGVCLYFSPVVRSCSQATSWLLGEGMFN